MKIRHPFLIKSAGFLAACWVRLWVGTLRYRMHFVGPNVLPENCGAGERYIFAFWHENMLLPAYHHGRRDVYVLISQHADGELIAELCRHLGHSVVRGSTTRGGIEAVRQMFRIGREAHLVITPDGPRGPRRQVQPGVVYLAARTGLPIVPVGFGFQRPWRVPSWDRFAVPRPWTLGTGVFHEPIQVPADIAKDQIEDYRRRVEEGLNSANAMAESWADAGGRWSAVW